MNRYIYFANRDEFYRINSSQIVFFTADGNYTYLQLASHQKPLAFTFSLQKMQAYLSEKLGDDARTFARIGKSHIVNLAYIYHIDISKQRLRLFDEGNGKEYSIPVSKEALKKLKEKLTASQSIIQ